jgi:hypothetical protein
MTRYDVQQMDDSPYYKMWHIPNAAQREAFMTQITYQILANTRPKDKKKEREWDGRQIWKEHRATPKQQEIKCHDILTLYCYWFTKGRTELARVRDITKIYACKEAEKRMIV